MFGLGWVLPLQPAQGALAIARPDPKLMNTPATAPPSAATNMRGCRRSDRGYVTAEALTFWKIEVANYKACIPATIVEIGQLGDIVTSFLRDHIEERHRTGASIVAPALSQAFPCKQ